MSSSRDSLLIFPAPPRPRPPKSTSPTTNKTFLKNDIREINHTLHISPTLIKSLSHNDREYSSLPKSLSKNSSQIEFLLQNTSTSLSKTSPTSEISDKKIDVSGITCSSSKSIENSATSVPIFTSSILQSESPRNLKRAENSNDSLTCQIEALVRKVDDVNNEWNACGVSSSKEPLNTTDSDNTLEVIR